MESGLDHRLCMPLSVSLAPPTTMVVGEHATNDVRASAPTKDVNHVVPSTEVQT